MSGVGIETPEVFFLTNIALGLFFLVYGMPEVLIGCPCRACAVGRAQAERAAGRLPIGVPSMFLCPRCSQRNCPEIMDHRNACLGRVAG